MIGRNRVLLGLVVSALLLGYQNRTPLIEGLKNMLTPRGIRNNNPGNIRHSAARWQGMAAQQTDAAFVQFVAPEFGIRALSRLLDNYAAQGLTTVRKIINRYAPPSENITSAYVEQVAQALRVQPDDYINVGNRKADLVQAIIAHENGQQPYTVAQISGGVSMA